SISSLLSADRSSIAREVLLWILFRFLGSFSIGDNVRRLLKLGKRLDLGNHGSIRGSWPMAISGSPRGHSVKTVTWCRSTQGRTSYLILPSNRASQAPSSPVRENEFWKHFTRTSSLFMTNSRRLRPMAA